MLGSAFTLNPRDGADRGLRWEEAIMSVFRHNHHGAPSITTSTTTGPGVAIIFSSAGITSLGLVARMPVHP